MSYRSPWSKRQKPLPDVYRYDDLPQPLRAQVIHIWASAIGAWSYPSRMLFPKEQLANDSWVSIADSFMRAKGLFRLSNRDCDPFLQCQHYLVQAEIGDALDIIEHTFGFINQ